MVRDLWLKGFLLGFCLFGVSLWSTAAELPAPIVLALQQANIPDTAVALYVQEAHAPVPLLAHHAERPMNPASVIKLVTTYAALEALGPAYRWQTEFHATGRLTRGRLKGDLILKGHGDPKITLERFWLWLRDLRARGIREIRGDLVIDRSFFDLPEADPGAFDGEPYEPYNALPDALLLNFRSHRLRFFPDGTQGRLRIAFEAPIPGARIVNRVRLTDGPCGNWKDAIAYQVQQGHRELVLHFSGTYATACGDQSLHLSLLDAKAQLNALFKPLWAELGGKWQGKVVEGTVPENARLLARFESPPLAEVIRDINKFSNNVMARQLYLTLGAEMLGAPATLEKSAQAVGILLATRGMEFVELAMENGSGLARGTRISARHLGQLLTVALRSPAFAEFESSLPIVAVDGTMRRRLSHHAIAGRARIKTGSLDGVRTMAGYVLDAKGRRMIVVCLINHPQAREARAVQDAVLEWVFSRP